MAEIEVRGLRELGDALKEFPEVIGKKYLRKATFAMAQLIEQDAISRAPVRTGALKSHIAIFKRKSDGDTAAYAIGIRGIKLTRKLKNVLRIVRKANGGQRTMIAGDVFYWHFMEWGYHDRKGVFHPGVRFMTKAFEAQKLNAIDKFRESLADGVARAAEEVKRTA
jgi:HK97 gp10 family phage protein